MQFQNNRWFCVILLILVFAKSRYCQFYECLLYLFFAHISLPVRSSFCLAFKRLNVEFIHVYDECMLFECILRGRCVCYICSMTVFRPDTHNFLVEVNSKHSLLLLVSSRNCKQHIMVTNRESTEVCSREHSPENNNTFWKKDWFQQV